MNVASKFKHRLGTISGKTLSLAKLFPAYLRDMFVQLALPLKTNDKNIFFTLDDEFLFRADDGLGREAYYVLKSFSDAGYNVYLSRSNDFKSYWRLGLFGRLIYTIRNCRLISHVPSNSKSFIYAFDSVRPDLIELPWKKFIYINIKKSTTCHIGNVIPMQFYMIPFIYALGLHENLAQYRGLPRKYRIFFGGSLNTAYYDSPIFKEKYPHLMTRLEGVRWVVGSGLDVWLINESHNLKEFLNTKTYLNRLIIVEITSSFPIKPKNWLRIVGQSDFFMCFSGTDYPMCHNAIEAMAVGCIPILAYEDWFDPKLEHGKNAIVYKDKEDLINKIRMVMQMPSEEILKLRQEVLKYYDQHLAKGRLIQRYEAESQQVSTLMLFPKIVSDHKGDVAAQDLIRAFKKLHIEERFLQ